MYSYYKRFKNADMSTNLNVRLNDASELKSTSSPLKPHKSCLGLMNR